MKRCRLSLRQTICLYSRGEWWLVKSRKTRRPMSRTGTGLHGSKCTSGAWMSSRRRQGRWWWRWWVARCRSWTRMTGRSARLRLRMGCSWACATRRRGSWSLQGWILMRSSKCWLTGHVLILIPNILHGNRLKTSCKIYLWFKIMLQKHLKIKSWGWFMLLL